MKNNETERNIKNRWEYDRSHRFLKVTKIFSIMYFF